MSTNKVMPGPAAGSAAAHKQQQQDGSSTAVQVEPSDTTPFMHVNALVGALQRSAEDPSSPYSSTELATALAEQAAQNETFITLEKGDSADTHNNDVWQQHLPYAVMFLFATFGWAPRLGKNQSPLGRVWTRLCVALYSLFMLGYFVVNVIRPGLVGASATSIGYLLGSLTILLGFATLSSLLPLTGVLHHVYTSSGFDGYKHRLQFVGRAVAVGLVLFEIAALFSGFGFLRAALKVTSEAGANVTLLQTLDVADAAVFIGATVVAAGFILAIFHAFQLMAILHEAQMDILVANWRRRTLSMLLMAEQPQPLGMTDSVRAWLRAGTAGDPVLRFRHFLPPSAPSFGSAEGDTMPLSAIVLQYMNVRRSFDFSASVWGVPLFIMLYIAWGFGLQFAYRAVFLLDFGGFPFMLLVPLINMFLLYPLAKLNSKWVSLSTAQLDFSVSRYRLEEQILLSQLQMKQPLQFKVFGIPITYSLLLIVQHVFVITIIVAVARWPT